MSLTGTKSRDGVTNLFFGLAELYLDDSATHIATNTPVLTPSEYFGCLVKVNFSIANTYLERYDSVDGMKLLAEVFRTSAKLSIDVDFVEMSQANLSYAMGGDGTGTNILDNLFSDLSTLRAELKFTYPNKVNSMTVVLPKAVVLTKTVNFDFAPEEPLEVPMKLTPLRVLHSSWTNPIGRIVFS